MNALERDGLVLRDSLSFVETVGRKNVLLALSMRGHVFCRDDVVLRVDEKLAWRRGRNNRLEVTAEHYQYHAWQRARPGRRRRNLLRFDDAHGGRLHRHWFDLLGRETEVQDIDRESMPALEAVIREALALVFQGTP
jgi:hypothetical protein